MTKRARKISVSKFGERERAIVRELARGEREISAGKGLSLDRVLADADRILARSRR